jgi:hypothetical protein
MYLRKACKRSQNRGSEIVAWKLVLGGPATSEAVGIVEVSKVSRMSAGFSSTGLAPLGEGERTTEGIRVWPRFLPDDAVLSVGGSVKETIGGLGCGGSSWIARFGEREVGLGTGEVCMIFEVASVGAGVDAGADGSQTTPGLILRLIVSPSLTPYS